MVGKIMTRSPACTKVDLHRAETRLGKRMDGELRRLDQKIDDSKDEILRHFDAVWERMKSILQAIGEGQRTGFEQVERRFTSLEAQHSQRFSDLEDVVSGHSREIATLKKRRSTKGL